MTRPATTTARETSRTLARIVLAACLLALTMASAAHAGSYVISNCPTAQAGNGDPGPWVIFNSPEASKGSCTEETGGWIGPRGASMGYQTVDGVQVTAPADSGITIREAKVWWSVPQDISGALSYALANADDGTIGEYTTPAEWKTTPNVYALPSDTTTFTLEDFCSNSLGGTNCTFGSGLNPDLQLYGAQLTLADSRLPTAKVTGGALASTATLSGTQSLGYTAEDADTGVRLVQLLIDGQLAATNDYLAQCPYANFLACPASESGTISWNTAIVPDGQHTIEALVQDAAQNTSTFYDATITTQNAPVNSTPPTITASQPSVGTALSAQSGGWSAPAGAGTITYAYQWQDCDSEGGDCQAIPGGDVSSYTPGASDIGRTLRVLLTAADNDGQNSTTSAPSGVVLPASGSLGAFPGSGTGTSGVGAPNGTPAAETALIHLAGSHTIYSSFAKRAFTLTGRLTDNQGNPISGATLDVLQQIAGTSTLSLVKHATTNSSGAFIVTVPAGPSRRIELAYRAYTGDPGYTTTASVAETVRAGVQLHVTTITGGPNGTILLSGKVSGPIPPQGTLVQILVHWRGHWELIRNPRTHPDGTFHVAYHFQGDIGRFPFWAEIPAGQVNFPYSTGYSNIVNVSIG